MIAKPAWCKTPCTSPNKLCRSLHSLHYHTCQRWAPLYLLFLQIFLPLMESGGFQVHGLYKVCPNFVVPTPEYHFDFSFATPDQRCEVAFLKKLCGPKYTSWISRTSQTRAKCVRYCQHLSRKGRSLLWISKSGFCSNCHLRVHVRSKTWIHIRPRFDMQHAIVVRQDILLFYP